MANSIGNRLNRILGFAALSTSTDQKVVTGDSGHRGRLPLSYYIIPIITVLVANGFVAWTISQHRPEYLHDTMLNLNPDGRGYVQLGHNMLLLGKYSRCAEPPYTPDVLRTPIYPLLAGGMDLLCGAWGIYALQVLCQMMAALLTLRFAWRLGLSSGAAVASSCIVAGDLVLAVTNFEPMSEALYLCLATTAVFTSLELLWSTASSKGRALLAGLVLGLAILTRPTGLYLPVVLMLLGGFESWRQRSWRPAWISLIIALTTAVVIVPWIARNYVVFGLPKLTNADSINLAYMSAAGALCVEENLSVEQAQVRIRQSYGLARFIECMDHWTAPRPVAQIDRELRLAAVDVIRRHLSAWLESGCRGVLKAGIAHNTGTFAEMFGQEWHNPGMETLLRFRLANFQHNFQKNPPVLLFTFGYETVFAVLVILLTALGLLAGWRSPTLRGPTLALAVVMLYYFCTIAIMGLDAYSRFRTMLAPLAGLLVGMFVNRFMASRQATPVRAGMPD
jgi:4-amino-4-deoxy-L-arabinose transferase-like glycosyltransferase